MMKEKQQVKPKKEWKSPEVRVIEIKSETQGMGGNGMGMGIGHWS